ncbi:MAG: hypothetical protein K940chlam1_00413 [Candidatus Anoxychlamydiales bacterium]|nr:hypothetical protein [Candidatus Anoxychlamydiales bacterium]NGX35886.1 hypothetical protein [Candidatus Anoxychlamydiales bacterium]
MASSIDISSIVPRRFLDSNDDIIEGLHIHKECGGSSPMQAYRTIKDGVRFFKCPSCKFENNKTITLQQDLSFYKAKQEFFRTLMPRDKELLDKYFLQKKEFEKLIEQQQEEKELKEQKMAKKEAKMNKQAEEGYNFANRAFIRGNYDEAFEICTIALRLSCKNAETNKKLLQLLYKALTERTNKHQKDMDGLKEMHAGNLNPKAISLFNRLVIRLETNMGLDYKNIASFCSKLRNNPQAVVNFEMSLYHFNIAFDLKNNDYSLLKNLVETFQSLAEIYLRIDSHSRAIEYYQKAIMLDEEFLKNDLNALEEKDDTKKRLNNSYLDMCDAYMKLSDAFILKDDYFQGLQLLKKCREIIEKIDEKFVFEELLGTTKMLLDLKFSLLEEVIKEEDTSSEEK